MNTPATTPVPRRWAWAEIDLDAVAHNVGLLRAVVAPAEVAVVVKADAYGHGAVATGRAALAAGATRLCVALASEGSALREAGIDAPVLVLSEQPPDAVAAMVGRRLTPTVSTEAGIDAVAAAAAGDRPVGVHLKVDTGMHRVGAAVADAAGLVARIRDHAGRVALEGVFTHLATADDPSDPTTAQQLAGFDDLLTMLATMLPRNVVVHSANSAGGLAHPAARRAFVRVGIAAYGISPGHGVGDLAAGLRPVLALRARVSFVKRLRAGDRISYGLRHTFARDATVATVPIGYADGVRRHLSGVDGRRGQDVLIGGRRCPIVGVVTMDQLMVDCGDDDVTIGDDVVLIGTQGDERIAVEEWADRLGTIGYEVTCAISGRIPRVLVGDGGAGDS